MIIERDVLNGYLEDVIKEYGSDRKVTQKVIAELQSKNMLEGDVNGIFKLTTPVSLVNEDVLYAFTKALFNATKNKYINPVDCFTKIEIEDGDKWKQAKSSKIKDREPVVFNELIKLNDTQWSTVRTIGQLYDMFNVRALTYNTKTQRPLRVSEHNGKIIQKIDINPDSVSDIRTVIGKNQYFQSTLTINMLVNDALGFKESDGGITIYSGELNITDGWHRLRGMFKSLTDNPKLEDIRVPIMLTLFKESRAIAYIGQMSEHNPINPKFKRSIKTTRLVNRIVDSLNSDGDSLLNGKITRDTNMLRVNNGEFAIDFSTLADTIDFTFAPTKQEEIFKMDSFILAGFNHIISVFDNVLKGKTEQKVWCAYICMLYLVRGHKRWKSTLDNLLTDVPVNDLPFKNISRVGIRNLLAEIKQYLPSNEKGVDSNE